jgi:hypothetical protein
MYLGFVLLPPVSCGDFARCLSLCRGHKKRNQSLGHLSEVANSQQLEIVGPWQDILVRRTWPEYCPSGKRPRAEGAGSVQILSYQDILLAFKLYTSGFLCFSQQPSNRFSQSSAVVQTVPNTCLSIQTITFTVQNRDTHYFSHVVY